MTFHKVLLKLHLWTGLAAAVFLLIVGGTGTILEFEDLTGKPPPVQTQVQGPTLPFQELIIAVRKAYPGKRILNASPPGRPGSLFSATLFPPGPHAQRVCVEPSSAVVVECPAPVFPKQTAGREFMGITLQLHKNLMLGRNGTVFVAWITVTSVFLALTGLILWWPHQIWWFIKGGSWRRFNFDLHSIAGLYSAVFFFVIALTGTMIHWGQVGRWIQNVTGQHRVSPQSIHSIPPSPGAPPMAPEDLVALGESKVPGEKTLQIGFGIRPTDPVNILRTSSSHGGGRSLVIGYLDQYTGALLAVDDPAKGSWVIKLLRNTVPIHEGSYWGILGRTLFGIASSALPIMSITGFIIWWRRKQTEWQRRRRQAKGLPLTREQLEDIAEEERENMDKTSNPAVAS